MKFNNGKKAYKFLNQIVGFKELGIEAGTINIKFLPQYDKPTKIRDEIPTLNRMGYMKIDLDPYSEDFIKTASISDKPVLEIGCAYGFIVQKILQDGNKIIASDLSQEHLSVLLRQTPTENLKNLNIYPGRFPEEISLPENSLSGVFASRIFHFLTGDEIKAGLDKIYSWLIKGGKFYFVALTPYHDSIKDKFLTTYQKNFIDNAEWPGVIENQWLINPDHKEYVEPYLHVFDIPQLEILLPKHGFEIEKIDYFTYPDDTTGGDKGHVGFIATKI